MTPQDRILLLAKNAQERVEFLYDMEKRTSANDLCRVAAVAPGHRRLSRSDNRNGFTHIKLFRILRGTRSDIGSQAEEFNNLDMNFDS
jgi:hypothetical protein